MSRVYLNAIQKQNENPKAPIKGKEQIMVRNSSGNYVFTPDEQSMVRRFLILGSDSASMYTSSEKNTFQNTQRLLNAIKHDGQAVVREIVEISKAGRAPRRDPALYALALVMTHGSKEAKVDAQNAIPTVARTGTDLLHLAAFVDAMRKWGRGVRRGFAKWYNEKDGLRLAQQLTKYANRDGWTHRDVLRLAHVPPATPTHDALFAFATDNPKTDFDFTQIDTVVADYMAAIADVKKLENSPKEAIKLIEKFELPREVLPTQLLNHASVWEALLPHMGYEALVKNLGKMTNVGLISPMSGGQKTVIEKLGNSELLRKSKLHPIKVITALMTYRNGHGDKGSLTWTPVPRIIDALDTAFYETFKLIVPTNKNTLICLDISGSMGLYPLLGIHGFTPRVASAVMAMATIRSEPNWEAVGFSHQLVRLPIGATMTLAQVIDVMQRLPFGATDLSLPMQWAAKNKIPVDTFVMYTDNETNCNRRHPMTELKEFRQKMSIPDAKLAVVAMQSNGFSVADPTDRNTMDFAGFDSALPSILADFMRGEI
jgi:60 kDa SS-A/Ro ribonucleoprotein